MLNKRKRRNDNLPFKNIHTKENLFNDTTYHFQPRKTDFNHPKKKSNLYQLRKLLTAEMKYILSLKSQNVSDYNTSDCVHKTDCSCKRDAKSLTRFNSVVKIRPMTQCPYITKSRKSSGMNNSMITAFKPKIEAKISDNYLSIFFPKISRYSDAYSGHMKKLLKDRNVPTLKLMSRSNNYSKIKILKDDDSGRNVFEEPYFHLGQVYK